MWVEDGIAVNDGELAALAQAFDNYIYDGVRELWGSEASPGVDGDPRLYGLFSRNLGSGVAAYFMSRHVYPQEIYPTSNQHEMFFFNLDAIGNVDIDNINVESTLAHEFQHMIRANIQDNDELWLNEGFSTFTQLHLYQDPGAIFSYLYQPQTQLNTWTEDGSPSPHYGAATLFLTYFYERYGIEGLRQISLDPGTGLDAFENVLRQMGEPGVNELFADWVLANFLIDPKLGDGRYGYESLAAYATSALPLATVTAYPYTSQQTLNQYGADYHVLTNLKGQSTLNFSFDAPATTALIETDASSGRWMWYSNRGDQSAMTLERRFDLSDVTSATFNYRVWYDIEDYWDYAYVLASRDDGATWDVLTTPHTTTENPQGSAYGAGYTGVSDGWLDEQIPLDAYTGGEVRIRFQMVTDDGINQPGLALDDISIPEIGYSSDLENDGGGWEASGWLRIDNVLPQQVWLQVVQQIGSAVEITRWSADGGGKWTLPLAEGVQQVVVVISPYAAKTTIPMNYTLSISAN